jgi:phospholipid/cholesterol/gamma-HCH transport system substrate-binding protein
MTQAFRLGLFIVIALLIFAGAVFLIGDKHLIFHRTYELRSQFQTVAGLNNGAEVRVGGMHEGTVNKILLPNRPDGKVTVIMDLEQATRNVIKKDSVAAIRSQGLVGDQYVEIAFGSPQAAGVKNGDTIDSEAPLEMADLLKKANQILGSAEGAVDNVGQAAGNLKSITGKIDNGNGTVGALLNDKSVYQHVNNAASELQDDMEALKHNFLTRGFFKNRGYEDTSDLTAHAIPSLPERPCSRVFEYSAAKIFAKPDAAKLDHEKMLTDAGQYLQSTPFGMAVVAVYGSDKGDTGKEKTLSEARAAVVRQYLASNFKFDDTRVSTIGLGKARAADEANKVDIVVYPPNASSDVRKKGEASRSR